MGSTHNSKKEKEETELEPWGLALLVPKDAVLAAKRESQSVALPSFKA